MEVREASAAYQVAPAYKQTEVGLIPSEWRTFPFREMVASYIDYRGRTPRKLGMDWGGGDILALSANNVQMGRIAPEKEAYFASEALYKKWMQQGECERGDVLLTMEAPLGNVAQIPDTGKYVLSQRVLLIKPKGWLMRDYLAHFMKGEYFQKLLDANSTGTTAKGIQRAKLDELAIYIPSCIDEQKTVASALSDTDALIEALEELLAKKRQIKQGAMQELLTGHRRLPGFAGEWQPTKLGDVAGFSKGKGLPKSVISEFGAEPCIHYGELFTFYGESISSVFSRTDESKDVVRSVVNDVLMPTSDVTPRGLAKASCVLLDGVILGGDILVIRCKPKAMSGTFLSYLIRYEEKQILQLVTGSTVFHLYGSDMAKFSFMCPPTLEEQTAIATVLADMDADMAALEAKLAKARDLKQGMMQELLTGRIRLV